MAKDCCASCEPGLAVSPRYRRALKIALGVNLAMFGVEIVGGMQAGSVSLLADAIDFAGDAANYGLALAVLSMGLAWRAGAALVKGLSMAAFGLLVLVKAGWQAAHGVLPEPITMGAVALLALAANVGVAAMLYAFRDGDANMRSVWLCSRNDAIANVAVGMAAVAVFGTGSAWPDLAVAAIIGGLALSSGRAVVRQARRELGEADVPRRRGRVAAIGAESAVPFGEQATPLTAADRLDTAPGRPGDLPDGPGGLHDLHEVPPDSVLRDEMTSIVLDSTLRCPHCGHLRTERMPTDACQWYYECEGCGALLRPKAGDCCVFCSYGSVPCPPIQAGGRSGGAG